MFALVGFSKSWVIGQSIGSGVVLFIPLAIAVVFQFEKANSIAMCIVFIFSQVLVLVSIIQWITARKLIKHEIVISALISSILLYAVLITIMRQS